MHEHICVRDHFEPASVVHTLTEKGKKSILFKNNLFKHIYFFFFYFYFLQLYFPNGISPMGNLGCLLRERQLRQSRAIRWVF